MHKALVEARLRRGDGMAASLLPMMSGDAYYASMMTDHDTNRRCDTYCTDTAFGTIAAVNEALVYSNTGEIELLPALPADWQAGSVDGLMARCKVEISKLSWDRERQTVSVTLTALCDSRIRLSLGIPWENAVLHGKDIEPTPFVELALKQGSPLKIDFTLAE